jgi:outer membrane protein TolC
MQGKSALLENRAALESLIESVVIAYYDIVQQKQKLEAIQDLLSVSQERSKLANAKMEIGSGSRLEFLQSQADLNQDSSSYINQEVSLRGAKVKLNQIMARDPVVDFQVSDSIPLDFEQPLVEWRKILLENNTAVAAAKARRDAASAGIKEARGHWLPSLNTGLAYSTAPEALNSAPASYSGDLTYSVMLNLPLFDRLATPTGISRAKLEWHQAETRVRLAESEALAGFELARSQYESGLRLVALEERNLQVSRLQAEGAQERYRVGASTPLEFRDAQTRLLDAQVRLITARQKAKQAETALQRLAGLLVKKVPANTHRQTEGK